MYNTILTSLEDQTLVISVNRPEKLNALNRSVIEELSHAFDEVYTNNNIKSVILTGVGDKAFVAGADITEFAQLGQEEGAALAKRGQDMVFNKIENCPKPVIAVVNGFALGGGCELAMSCHMRIATTNAQFGQPEVNLGLIPGYGGTQRLTHLIGKGKAMEYLLTGDLISAEIAQGLGLANYVRATEEAIPFAKKLLSKIHTKAPIAVSHIIKLVNDAASGSQDGFINEIKLFGACFGTSDMIEGTTAFLQKRKPVFSGK